MSTTATPPPGPGTSTSQWKELHYTFLALGSLYFLLFFVAFIQIIRITCQSRLPLKKWTTQKMFLVMLMLYNIVRTSYFIMTPFIELGKFNITRLDEPYLWIIDDFGALLFWTTFTSLILFWAEILYHARHHESSRWLRPGYIAVNVLVYGLNCVLWGLLILDDVKRENTRLLQIIDSSYFAFLAVLAAGGFAYFGITLFLLLKRNPISSVGRSQKLREVGGVTAICTLAFLVRPVLLFFLVVRRKSFSHISLTWEYILVYYFVSEVVPTLLVLYVLRKIPPRYAHTPPIGTGPPTNYSSQYTAVSRSR